MSEAPTKEEVADIEFALKALVRGGYADGKSDITDDDVKIIAAVNHWMTYELVGQVILEQVRSGAVGITVVDGVLTSTGDLEMSLWCIEHDKPLGGCTH